MLQRRQEYRGICGIICNVIKHRPVGQVFANRVIAASASHILGSGRVEDKSANTQVTFETTTPSAAAPKPDKSPDASSTPSCHLSRAESHLINWLIVELRQEIANTTNQLADFSPPPLLAIRRLRGYPIRPLSHQVASSNSHDLFDAGHAFQDLLPAALTQRRHAVL